MSELRVVDRDESPYYTAASLAKKWTLSERYVRGLIKSKALPSYKFGATRRIKPEDADAFEAERREESIAA